MFIGLTRNYEAYFESLTQMGKCQARSAPGKTICRSGTETRNSKQAWICRAVARSETLWCDFSGATSARAV